MGISVVGKGVILHTIRRHSARALQRLVRLFLAQKEYSAPLQFDFRIINDKYSSMVLEPPCSFFDSKKKQTHKTPKIEKIDAHSCWGQ